MNRTEMLENILNEEFDFDSNRYFYHITQKGNGRKIAEEGLFLEEPRLQSTTIEITPEMMNGIGKYIEEEYVPNSVMKREEMVLLGIPYDMVDYVIKKSGYELPYMLENEYVLGYIELDTLEYNINPEYRFGNQL